MKPTKNQIFCPACRRTKMLFETEKKALTFLKFNKEEIIEENGKAPERAYYCDMCIGWHLTSKKEFFVESSIELLAMKAKKATSVNFEVPIENIKKYYDAGQYERAIKQFISATKTVFKTKWLMTDKKKENIKQLESCFPMITVSFSLLIEKLKLLDDVEEYKASASNLDSLFSKLLCLNDETLRNIVDGPRRELKSVKKLKSQQFKKSQSSAS